MAKVSVACTFAFVPLLCGCSGRSKPQTQQPASVPAASVGGIPDGQLGFPLGRYLTIAGTRPAREYKLPDPVLLVDTVNGRNLEPAMPVQLENVEPASVPEGIRCVLRGYESGGMIGIPDEVLRAENRPAPQAGWQFHRYFVVTSVVEPGSVRMQR